MLWGPSASGRTSVVIVIPSDAASQLADNSLQSPQLIPPLTHLAVDEFVNDIDASINALGVTVECVWIFSTI